LAFIVMVAGTTRTCKQQKQHGRVSRGNTRVVLFRKTDRQKDGDEVYEVYEPGLEPPT